jgi:hypothetical protein
VTAEAEELRAIERLKATYCRALDTKQWDQFRSLFASDFVSDTSESGGEVVEGADAFVDFVSHALAKAVTVHQVQQPEIELLSGATATGVWAMQDIVRFRPGVTLHGFGHYHETYEKIGGRWLIKTSKLTRLREEIRTPLITVFVSDRLRRVLRLVSRRAGP